MFVRTFSILTVATALLGTTSVSVHANDKEATVPLTVTVTDVRAGDVPLYVSIQTKETYRSMKGEGGILKETTSGDITRTFNLKEGGEYAISIWHDLDDDGRFSMTESYEILDGWGSSGEIPRGSAPTFDDAKVTVPSFGASTTVAMIYPEG